MDVILEVILWSSFATILSQGISIATIWMLHLPPRKLAHEIEDEQNPAVGGLFFIISVIVALYVGVAAGDGYSSGSDTLESLSWLVGGAALALILTSISFYVAYWMMTPIPGESLYAYIRREIIAEKNAALAFFLGGLAIAPFTATIFQVI